MVLVNIALIRLCCLISWKPYVSKLLNNLELINCIGVMICIYIILFLNFTTLSLRTIIVLSWAAMSNSVFNICSHLCVNFFSAYKDLRSYIEKRKFKKECKEDELKRIENRRMIVEKNPGEFIYYEKYLLEVNMKDELKNGANTESG